MDNSAGSQSCEELETLRKLTMTVKVEQRRQILHGTIGMAGVWELGVGVSELIKEWMTHGLDGGETLGGSILEKTRDQVDRFRRGFAEDLDWSVSTTWRNS
jgi:hypothetical protein